MIIGVVDAQGRGGPQVPTPKNLQFFPKDMTGQQILPIMQNFNAALGVNCTYCHNAEPPVEVARGSLTVVCVTHTRGQMRAATIPKSIADKIEVAPAASLGN